MDRRTFLRITRDLVDGRRLEILERIASTRDEISCVALRAEIPISRATLSHHLKKLATAGLVETRRESKYVLADATENLEPVYETPKQDWSLKFV